MTRVTGAVLAGGASRRMGRDKRWIRVDGVPLMVRAVDALRPVCDELLVIGSLGGKHDERLTDVRVLEDLRPAAGPLAGIETALLGARHDTVLVVAVDHPWLSTPVLRLLVEQLSAQPDAQVAMLEPDQPLVSAWRADSVEAVTELLERGERRATSLADHLRITRPDWRGLDPQQHTISDLDTPDDLLRSTRRRRIEVMRLDGDGGRLRADDVVIEEPLEIRAAGPDQEPMTVVTTLRTPGNEIELAAGWVVSEGIASPGEIVTITYGDPIGLARADDQVTVHLDRPVDLDAGAHRHTLATASCGVCGRASIDELAMLAAPVARQSAVVDWDVLSRLPDTLRAAQAEFAATGGLHATGIFTFSGELVTLREDVGRHNALDAAIGVHVLGDSLPLDAHVVVLSGRVGFELVAKAVVAGAPVVAAVGAPTDLAVRTAQRFGVTVVGFLREGAGNVYSCPERLAAASTSSTGVDSSNSWT